MEVSCAFLRIFLYKKNEKRRKKIFLLTWNDYVA